MKQDSDPFVDELAPKEVGRSSLEYVILEHVILELNLEFHFGTKKTLTKFGYWTLYSSFCFVLCIFGRLFGLVFCVPVGQPTIRSCKTKRQWQTIQTGSFPFVDDVQDKRQKTTTTTVG